MCKVKSIYEKVIADALLPGAFVLAETATKKLEKLMNRENRKEKVLQRKLIAIQVIYHAIGIFYNE